VGFATCRNHLVGRLGLEPRTYGLKDGPSQPDHAKSSAILVGRGSASPDIRSDLGDVARPAPDAASPRTATVSALLEAQRSAFIAGDLAAARVVHDAIGRLLQEGAHDGPKIVNLDERRKRERE
jgi:hypothetical protein